MQYETLRLNDNGTVRVRLTINIDNVGHVLEQDLDPGSNKEEFDTNIKEAISVFNDELRSNLPTQKLDYIPPIGTTESVNLGS